MDHHQPQRIFPGIFRQDHDRFLGHRIADGRGETGAVLYGIPVICITRSCRTYGSPDFFGEYQRSLVRHPNGDSENQVRKDRLGIKEPPIYPRRQDRPVCGAGKSDNDEQDCMPTTPAAVITDARKHMSPVFYKKI
jgi:hypothetical protein